MSIFSRFLKVLAFFPRVVLNCTLKFWIAFQLIRMLHFTGLRTKLNIIFLYNIFILFFSSCYLIKEIKTIFSMLA